MFFPNIKYRLQTTQNMYNNEALYQEFHGFDSRWWQLEGFSPVEATATVFHSEPVYFIQVYSTTQPT